MILMWRWSHPIFYKAKLSKSPSRSTTSRSARPIPRELASSHSLEILPPRTIDRPLFFKKNNLTARKAVLPSRLSTPLPSTSSQPIEPRASSKPPFLKVTQALSRFPRTTTPFWLLWWGRASSLKQPFSQRRCLPKRKERLVLLRTS